MKNKYADIFENHNHRFVIVDTSTGEILFKEDGYETKQEAFQALRSKELPTSKNHTTIRSTGSGLAVNFPCNSFLAERIDDIIKESPNKTISLEQSLLAYSYKDLFAAASLCYRNPNAELSPELDFYKDKYPGTWQKAMINIEKEENEKEM